ncbi:cupin domain-containing protein [Pelagovum pacificum]|uniref:Cupin domain-containing protein n=1 Tax=Pelagovum pacificum TaxID=2588711 RepID=A0A5C5GFL4_9RHOB|nr:cupin domain-containing protein [Pelagovum pacificum]QQA43328.1 cupin domain-containing protein [Pelagovum pacificum]TNY33535.1 cupin domain-containing protein [Pelagovum pacificum]
MIIRKNSVALTPGVSNYPEPYNQGRGNLSYRHLTEGHLSQYGVALETLHPGGQSSQMHWESHEDEFLYMLEGNLTVVENGDETIIGPGDSCCWPAGVEVAHTLKNHTDRDAVYLIMGTRDPENICHYPGLDLLATPEGYTHLDGTPWPKFTPPGGESA